jgi:hypothetical protein
MWIWYFDRQGIIYSQGMSFIKDLPYFLVLLFAFQRFRLEDWGVIPILNPNAKRAHQGPTDATNIPSELNRCSTQLKGNKNQQAVKAREQRKTKVPTIDINLSELQQPECFLPGTDKLESVLPCIARLDKVLIT